MTYKPFSEIGKGDVFNLVGKPNIPLMKTADDKAILLKGYWEGDRLHKRGDSVTFATDTCVTALVDIEIAFGAINIDPVDPRRKFWKEGDQLTVGRNLTGKINVFAGLFVYHGFSMGSYYSKTGNEIKGGTAAWARDRAQDEGIPFVLYDSFDWTNDPTLARERAQAQKDFDDAKRAAEAALAKVLKPQTA